MKLSNSYIGLPEEFYQVVNPTPVRNPKTLIFNEDLADSLDIKLKDEEVSNFFSGNGLPEDSVPIALNYACLLYTSPSPRDVEESRMPASA